MMNVTEKRVREALQFLRILGDMLAPEDGEGASEDSEVRESQMQAAMGLTCVGMLVRVLWEEWKRSRALVAVHEQALRNAKRVYLN